MKGIREEMIANLVEKKLDGLEFSPAEKEYLATAIQRLKDNWLEEKEKQLAISTAKFQQASERLNRLTDAFLDGTIGKELYEEGKTALLFQKRAIEDQLTLPSVPETIQRFLELAGSARYLYQIAKKRRLLNIVTSNSSASPETLDFTYAIPFNEVAEREKSIDGSPSKVIHRTLDKLLDSLATKMDAMYSVAAALEHETLD